MSVARPSSTVLLLRQSGGGPEVFMVRRHARAAFGNAYAFPGGVIDPSDNATHSRCKTLTATQADKRLAVECDGLDYYSAAIRELFEETGVLLAIDANGGWSVGDQTERHALDALRRDLNSGKIAWPTILDDCDFYLACNSLHYFAHWITPLSEPKRFSTRFFAAKMPENQEAIHDGEELTESCWMRPADVLDAYESRKLGLIYPTYVTLAAIRNLRTIDQVLAWAGHQAAGGVPSVRPSIIDVDGKQEVVLPDDDRYPAGDSSQQ